MRASMLRRDSSQENNGQTTGAVQKDGRSPHGEAEKKGACECHRTVILNAGVQVGEVRKASGSSDAR
jgi:hypothetical protein